MKRPWPATLLMALAALAQPLLPGTPPAAAQTQESEWTRAFYVEDAAQDFLAFYSRTKVLPLSKRIGAFQDRFARVHSEALDAFVFRQVSRNSFYQSVLPTFLQSLDTHPEQVASMQERTRLFEQQIPRVANRVQASFPPGSVRLDRTYVLGPSFGLREPGIRSLRDRHTLYLAADAADERPIEVSLAERMFRLVRTDILAARPEHRAEGVGYTAFDEGAAAAYASELFPGFGDQEVLGYADAAWAETMSNRRDLVYDVLRSFESTDPEQMQRLCSDHPGTALVPPRLASYVGLLAVQRLRRAYDWPTMIGWDSVELRSHVESALTVI